MANILSRRDIVVDKQGKRHRVLFLEPKHDRVHVIVLDDDCAWPVQWQLSELQLDVLEGRFSIRESTDQALVVSDTEEEQTPAAKLQSTRWSQIEGLVNNPAVFFRIGRKALIEAHTKDVKASATTIRTLLRLYWQGGMTKDALFPNFDQCGKEKPRATPKPTAPDENRSVRGRDCEDNRAKFYVSPELAEQIYETAKTILKEKTATRKTIYKAVCKEHGWVFQDDENKARLVPASERPSRRQVNYAINRRLTIADKLKRSGSPMEFENNHGPKLGSILQECLGVGHQYEIDSTIVDLWLVAKDNRNKVIGKPTLYLIIDRYSRLIVGFHVSLDAPSWSGAMEAILSLVEDKEQMCKSVGAEYVPRAWLAHGRLPFMLVTDRGSEYLGYDSDRIAADVECGLVNVPAYFSSRKGTVECTFKLTHVPLKDLAAGYQPPAETTKRHGDCYAGDATYTLDELKAELIDICTMNNLRMHPGMSREIEPILAGVDPVPADVWEYDVKNRGGLMSSYNAEFLRMKLLHKRRAVVTQHGIRLNGLYYTCQHALDQQWFVKAGVKVFPVNTTYDRRLVNTIFIHDPKNPRRYYKAALTPACKMFTGMSSAEASVVIQMRKNARKRAEDHNLELELELEAKRQARAERAKLQTEAAIKAAAGQGRETSTKDIRDEEAKGRRQELAAHGAEVAAQGIDTATTERKSKRIEPRRSTVGQGAPLPLDNPLQALMEMDDE